MLSLNRVLCSSIAGEVPDGGRKQVPSRSLLHWWRRMALQLMVVSQAAKWQTVLTGMDGMNNRKTKELEERLGRSDDPAANKKNSKKASAQQQRVTTPMAKGKVLPPSKSVKARLRAEDCPHVPDRVVARGGHILWLTCLDCGTRWERLEGQESIQLVKAPLAVTKMDQSLAPLCRCQRPMVIRKEPDDDRKMFWGCAAYGKTSGCRLVRELRPGDQVPKEAKGPQEFSLVELDEEMDAEQELVPVTTTVEAALTRYKMLRAQGRSEASAASAVTRMAPDDAAAEAILEAIAKL